MNCTFGYISKISSLKMVTFLPWQLVIAVVNHSILQQGGLTFFAVKRFREGAGSAFAPSYDPDAVGSTPTPGYSAYPGAPDTQPDFPDDPFGGKPAPLAGQQDYQPPMY